MTARRNVVEKMTADYYKTQDIIKKRRQHSQKACVADCSGYDKCATGGGMAFSYDGI